MSMVIILVAGDGKDEVLPSITLEKSVADLLDAKKRNNLRPRYLTSLRQYLAQFVRGREKTLIGSISTEDIEAWFQGRKEAPVTRASNIGRLSSLFSFAVRRRWIEENPCDRLERATIQHAVPSVLTLEQCEKLLRHCEILKPVALAYLTLTLFAGLRPEEAGRVGWESIDLERGILRIDAGASKVRRRRIIELEPNAREWLRLAHARNATLPVGGTGRKRYLRAFRLVLGLKVWKQDCLRHTAASYLLAKHESAGKVALMLGNSESILLRHYRELVSAEDCARFWALVPSAQAATQAAAECARPSLAA